MHKGKAGFDLRLALGPGGRRGMLMGVVGTLEEVRVLG